VAVVCFCSVGLAAMKRRLLGLAARANNVNTSIKWNHCILHTQELVSKHMNPVSVDKVVTYANFSKGQPVKSRLFRELCADLDSDNATLLPHSEVSSLSC
jgi:hypothetical protein